MRTKKKILSLLMVAAMVLVMLPIMTIPAIAAEEVCSIGNTAYTDLTTALSAVQTGQTIKLLQSIDYTQGIIIKGISITFDLNGFNLNVVVSPELNASDLHDYGLIVTVDGDNNPGHVNLAGNGEFNVSGYVGVSAYGGSTATVTNAMAPLPSVGRGGEGAHASFGGKITVLKDVEGHVGAKSSIGGMVTVKGDATGYYCGAYASGEDSFVEVSGNSLATGVGITTEISWHIFGAYAEEGGTTIVHKNATADTSVDAITAYGALANFESTITVYGNAVATGKQGTGACAQNGLDMDNPAYSNPGGKLTVFGNAIGVRRGATSVNLGGTLLVKGNAVATGTDGIGARANSGSKLTVEGNVEGVMYGALALNNGEIVINGNVTATNVGVGAVTDNDGPGTVIVDGTIAGTHYVDVGTFSAPAYKTADEVSIPTTKNNYRTYSDNGNTVWVKIPVVAPPSIYNTTGRTSTTGNNTITAPTDDNGWIDAAKRVTDAEGGSVFTIDMKNNNTVSGVFLELVAGKDVDIIFDMGGSMKWVVNCKNIPEGVDFAALNLGVVTGTDFVPAEVRNIDGSISEVQLRLSHDGELPFPLTLTVTLDKQNAGYFANLLYYNKETEGLEFKSAGKIAEDGTVAFGFDHASDYLIAVSKTDMTPEIWQNPFNDVRTSDWFYGDVEYAVTNGLFAGTSGTVFSPNTPMTRAMLVTVLHRMEGEPEVEEIYAQHMMDVEQPSWYADAMGWAVEQGVISGYGEGLYGPGDPVTREQLAVLLYRYAGAPDLNAGQLEFADAGSVSDWAWDAMIWATYEDIITGKPGGLLDPQGVATRAEVAAMLHRFLESA